MRSQRIGWQTIIAKSLISPMIFIFSILIALLVIDWLSDEPVLVVFAGSISIDASTFSSIIATLIPPAIIAPVMIFSALFQAPARLPENYVRAVFAVGSIFCSLVMFALLLKNLLNFNFLRNFQECELVDPSRISEICKRYVEIPIQFASDLRAVSIGIVFCLIIFAVYQAACIVLHIEQETNKRMELRRDVF